MCYYCVIFYCKLVLLVSFKFFCLLQILMNALRTNHFVSTGSAVTQSVAMNAVVMILGSSYLLTRSPALVGMLSLCLVEHQVDKKWGRFR